MGTFPGNRPHRRPPHGEVAGMVDGPAYERVGGRGRRGHRGAEGPAADRRPRAAVRRGRRQRPEDVVPGRLPPPEIAAAYDGAQERAATEVIGWLAAHATTRVGPRGRQVQVPVDRLEAVVVRHYTSRAGDPHRHLHLQVGARVWAAGRWRGLHSVGVVDSIEAVNGIGHAAVACDPGFRRRWRRTATTSTRPRARSPSWPRMRAAFSARARQITANTDRYEAAWRRDHPGEEPGPRAAAGVGPAGVGAGPPRQDHPHRRRGPGRPVARRAATTSASPHRPPTPPPARRCGGRRWGGSTGTPSPTWS